MGEFYTRIQNENIYSSTKEQPSKIMKSNINDFFDEISVRKRNDEMRDGLQASCVILSDKFAAKINENDGIATHYESHLNLTRNLERKDTYFTEKGIRQYSLTKDDNLYLSCNGIEGRIICNDNDLYIVFLTRNDIKTSFQYKVIKEFLENSKRLLTIEKLKHVEFYVLSNNFNIKQEQLENVDFNEINNEIFHKKLIK